MRQLPQLALVLAISGLFASRLHADQADDELKKFQGKWKIQSAERGGKPFEVNELGIEQIHFDGKKMSLMHKDKPVATYDVIPDPKHDPKRLAWVKDDKSWLPTIYEFSDGTLRICFPMVPADEKGKIQPPKSFETKDKPLIAISAKKSDG